MTLSDLVCIISPTDSFPVVRSEIAEDDVSCMVTARPLYGLNLDTDLLIFFPYFFPANLGEKSAFLALVVQTESVGREVTCNWQEYIFHRTLCLSILASLFRSGTLF